MANTPRTTFFDLPSEIRNQIYSLVSYHYESGGIISPLSNKKASHASIALLDGRRYPVAHNHCYNSVNQLPPERLEQERFEETTNAMSKHFCTPHCLRPPNGASRVCHQMREEVLAVFFSVNTFHFEMSNFEVTNNEGLLTHHWSPIKWWRAIGDTNLRRITMFSLVCHPTNKETKEANVMFRYRYIGREAQVSVQRIDLLAWEKVRRANMGYSASKTPTNRHPADMTRFEMYRLRKWVRSSDFEVAVESEVSTMQECGVHVRALERLVAALEPWDFEYLQDHISLDDELIVGTVKPGRGELALKWDFLS